MSNEISQLLIEAIGHDNAGNYLNMVEVGKKAVQLYPDVPEAHYVLGCGYMRSGSYELATNSFQNSVLKKPDCVEALNALAICYFNLGKFRKAEKFFSVVIRKKPDYARAYYSRAECWMLMGAIDSVFAEWSLLSTVDRNLASTLQQRFFKFLMS
ncbi:MAG: tetratricopeptide repeat protein [Desulfurivibrionaceae bacterium]|nr:tetratricopeptide repeat protein [Desulfobulbales bacterium]MDT8334460.1 tetratricopeptide repeat protein [Desulfurivibrionaceae bacterium]